MTTRATKAGSAGDHLVLMAGVMIRFFERGYLKLLPIVAVVTMLSGLWLLWIVSDGFNATYMGSRIGMALSTGGALAIVAFVIGIVVMRPALMTVACYSNSRWRDGRAARDAPCRV